MHERGITSRIRRLPNERRIGPPHSMLTFIRSDVVAQSRVGRELRRGCPPVPTENLVLAHYGSRRAHVTCPIKGNVKRKNLPVGPMPTFFSRHSAHPFERPLLLPRVVLLGPKVQLRFRVRSGETLLPRGSIFATVTAPFVS